MTYIFVYQAQESLEAQIKQNSELTEGLFQETKKIITDKKPDIDSNVRDASWSRRQSTYTETRSPTQGGEGSYPLY